MEKYIKPEMEIIEFDAEDIITTSDEEQIPDVMEEIDG